MISPKGMEKIQEYLFLIWTHDTAKSPSFSNYLISDTGKVKFTMQIADEKKWVRIP